MILGLVTLALALPYCSAGKDPLQKKSGSVGIAKVLDKKAKSSHIFERENKMDWDSLSQMVGAKKSTSEIGAAETTATKHRTDSCKHCRENIFYGEEVSKPHVGERIRRISKVDWNKM